MAKFCPNCGNEVNEGADICLKCGKTLNTPANNINSNNSKKSNGMAVAGFILSFFFSLLGLIFSIVGLKKSKETGSGKGLSIAGIIISSISMVVGFIIIAIFGVAIFAAIDESTNSSWDNSNKSIWDYTTDYDYDYDYDY